LKLNYTLTHSAQGNATSQEKKLDFAPSHEPICLARKPLSEKSVAENVLEHGTGAINIDGCRIASGSRPMRIAENHNLPRNTYIGGASTQGGSKAMGVTAQGRWPANLIHDGSEEVRECFPETHARGNKTKKKFSGGKYIVNFGQEGGWEECGNPGDSGNASRFFKSIIYASKASKAERGTHTKGAMPLFRIEEERFVNSHPTVKPIALMEYLITLASREGATILDPFMGSGTTGVACQNLNRNFIGIELDAEYFKIAEKRIDENSRQGKLFSE
jgi:site-specific DNA-methyltransferase (adenine-specific)